MWNFAVAAGLIEMLLQSQGGEIYLLPALPDVRKQGAVTGLVARGGYVVNINWNNGKLSGAIIIFKTGWEMCRPEPIARLPFERIEY